MPFWLLMILLPAWSWTRRIVRSLWIIVPSALLYTMLIIPQFGGAFAELANPTLGGIQALLGSPAGATVGWVHFLAFDLFVGRWAYLDSRKIGLSAWFTSPILFFVLMFGPLGFIFYLIAREIKTKDWTASPAS